MRRLDIMAISVKPNELVDLGLDENEQDVIDDGIRHILRAHPEYKIEIAIKKYKKEVVSIGKAANIAGTSLEDMKELLKNRGVALKGLENIKEIQEDAERAKKAIQ